VIAQRAVRLAGWRRWFSRHAHSRAKAAR
jgi:hypothetical protein